MSPHDKRHLLELIKKLLAELPQTRTPLDSHPISEDDPSHGQRKADEEASHANIHVPSTFGPSSPQIPPDHYRVTCKIEQDWWAKRKPFVEIAGVIILSVYTLFTIKMYCANKKAADAAKSAADIAKRTLEATNRPWVSFDMQAVSPLTFDADGAHLSFAVLFKNTGGSTAVSVGFKTEMWTDPTPSIPNGILRERERLCREAAQDSILSKALFVGSPRTDKWIISYPTEKVSASVAQLGQFSPAIIACTEYRSPVSDTFFETASIMRLGREQYTDSRGRLSSSIVPPSPIPIDLLFLVQDPILGLTAK